MGTAFLESFLGLGLIEFAYRISLLVDAWGFLAVFSAAVALRHTGSRSGIDTLDPGGGCLVDSGSRG